MRFSPLDLSVAAAAAAEDSETRKTQEKKCKKYVF